MSAHPGVFALICLTDGLVVNVSEIAEASRCGNYTHVRMREPRSQLYQIWDEDQRLWSAIIRVVK